MANHCFDVVCTSCGACWCERGCKGHGPDPKLVADFKLPKKERKYRSPYFNAGPVDTRCAYCGSNNVYMW